MYIFNQAPMLSQRAQQSRVIPITWTTPTYTETAVATNITIPWLVDEVRVVSVASQTSGYASGATSGTNPNLITTLHAPTLFGGPDHGTYLGTCTATNWVIDGLSGPVTGVTNAANASGPRYIFPPSNRLRVSGSYNFLAIKTSDVKYTGGGTEPTTTYTVVLEFIQYVPDEIAIQQISDLELMKKSGKRRL